MAISFSGQCRPKFLWSSWGALDWLWWDNSRFFLPCKSWSRHYTPVGSGTGVTTLTLNGDILFNAVGTFSADKAVFSSNDLVGQFTFSFLDDNDPLLTDFANAEWSASDEVYLSYLYLDSLGVDIVDPASSVDYSWSLSDDGRFLGSLSYVAVDTGNLINYDIDGYMSLNKDYFNGSTHIQVSTGSSFLYETTGSFSATRD